MTRADDANFPKTAEYLLIELVVSISILGMAAAFALPKFTHLANDARVTQVAALDNQLREVTEAAHDQYIAHGGGEAPIRVNGRVVALQNGYPDLSMQGIQSSVTDNDSFRALATPVSIAFQKIGAPNSAQCSVIYTAASSSTIAATTLLQTAGC